MSLSIFITVTVAMVRMVVTGSGVQLDLPEGAVVGREELSDSGRPYFGYYGIPYALPPVGPRR